MTCCGRFNRSTGVLISAITVLLIALLYGLYEILGLIYLFSFDLLGWFSVITGMFSVFSAIAALIGRSRESLQTLTAAFIWTCVSLGCATIMTAFLITFQAETSTTRESRSLSILRITSMYFFLVLLPLSWMAYEIRELAVLIFHDICPGSEIKRKYDEEMDREVRTALREGRDGMASADEQEERIKMMEIGRKRRRSSRKGKERAISSNDESDRGRQRRRSSSRQRSADV